METSHIHCRPLSKQPPHPRSQPTPPATQLHPLLPAFHSPRPPPRNQFLAHHHDTTATSTTPAKLLTYIAIKCSKAAPERSDPSSRGDSRSRRGHGEDPNEKLRLGDARHAASEPGRVKRFGSGTTSGGQEAVCSCAVSEFRSWRGRGGGAVHGLGKPEGRVYHGESGGGELRRFACAVWCGQWRSAILETEQYRAAVFCQSGLETGECRETDGEADAVE